MKIGIICRFSLRRYVLYSLLGTSFRDDLVRVPPSILTKPVGKAEGKAGVLIRGRRLAVCLLSLVAKQKARQVFCLGVEGWLFTVLTKTVGKAGSKVGVLFKGRWLAILVLTEPVGKAGSKVGVLFKGRRLAVYCTY